MQVYVSVYKINKCSQLKKSLDKNPTLRCSDWNRMPLNELQLNYAALDAYVMNQFVTH